MRKLFCVALLSVAAILVHAQGGFAGGFQGGQGGQAGDIYDRSSQRIQDGISRYLDTPEVRNILTPGGFSEWRVTLKAGQVIFSEAWSDAFDPALQIVNEKEKLQFEADDRYPGDQRPLLMWRCTEDGVYSLRAKSFQDKAGGQFFIRFKVYDCVDAPTEGMADRSIDASTFLIHVPMKAGEMRQLIVPERPDFGYLSTFGAISPTGLPDINLVGPIAAVFPNSLIAPVDGDYYLLTNAQAGVKKIRIGAALIKPGTLEKSIDGFKAKAGTTSPATWNLPVKKGDLLKVATPDLALQARILLYEVPDIADYDLKKPDKNPFFPQPADKRPNKGQLYAILPGRVRDGRVVVFQALRDAKLWVVTDGAGANKDYTVSVTPAAAEFAASSTGKLRIGNTDYWAFDGKVGDVMTLQANAADFNQRVIVRDPGLGEMYNFVTNPDESTTKWNMVISTPGRYLVSMACFGDGGAGDYSLNRTVFPPKEFSKSQGATGEFATTNMQVWKFTAAPGDPLLLKWTSNAWDYGITIYNSAGEPANIGLQYVSDNSRYAIVSVRQPTTFLIVLTPHRTGSKYSIELQSLPGGKG